jgi:DNA-binding response OmpR family regulator
MAEQKHILIVDDDIELGALLAKAVADMSPSYTVKLARDVDEAMVQVRRSQTTENVFDLVITDIKMSGLNGLELLEALHALAPGLRTIAMTAYTSSEIAAHADELGVQAYLTKPFMISEFRSVVRTTLDAPVRRRQPTVEPPSPSVPALPQREEVSRALSSLRTMTAADAVFLLRNDGTLLAADAREPSRDVTDLGTALQAAQQAITEQMTRLFDHNCAVRQSFYGTDAYSVCTYRIDGVCTAAVVFGPEVREGQVWYYMRDAAGTLSRALGADAPPTPGRRRAVGESVLDMLDRFFPSTQQASADVASPTRAAQPREPDASPVPSIEARATETRGAAVPEATAPSEGETRAAPGLDAIVPELPAIPEDHEPQAVDPSVADNIDWDAADGMSWDTILEETDKGWEGISLEEARRLGLVDGLEGA